MKKITSVMGKDFGMEMNIYLNIWLCRIVINKLSARK